jgi:hypothetical protein
VGDRTYLTAGTKPLKFVGQSAYYGQFVLGANIYPHSFWMVDPTPDPKLGFDPDFPYLESSARAVAMSKREYKGVEVEGNVESRFLYAVVTGTELVPFVTTSLQMAVLPIEPLQFGYKMIGRDEAAKSGFPGLAASLSDVEMIWETKRGGKAKKMDVYESLDYSQKFTKQKPRAKFKVVYNAAGTNLAASVIRQTAKEAKTLEVDGQKLELQGVVAEHKVCRYETESEEEAYYLVSVLNSRLLDRLLKPLQSKGQWGERDIEKKPLEFPIPRYDPKSKVHERLSELGRECSLAVEKVVPTLVKKYTSLRKVRGEVRNAIDDKLKEIDDLVAKLLSKNSDILDFFSQADSV